MGHPCYPLADVPPQPNSRPRGVRLSARPNPESEGISPLSRGTHFFLRNGLPISTGATSSPRGEAGSFARLECVWGPTSGVEVLHLSRERYFLPYTSGANPPNVVRVKLNRAFFPRRRKSRPFATLWSRHGRPRASENLVHPFTRVISYLTRHLAGVKGARFSPAVNPCLGEIKRRNVQSTGQESPFVRPRRRYRRAKF